MASYLLTHNVLNGLFSSWSSRSSAARPIIYAGNVLDAIAHTPPSARQLMCPLQMPMPTGTSGKLEAKLICPTCLLFFAHLKVTFTCIGYAQQFNSILFSWKHKFYNISNNSIVYSTTMSMIFSMRDTGRPYIGVFSNLTQ